MSEAVIRQIAAKNTIHAHKLAQDLLAIRDRAAYVLESAPSDPKDAALHYAATLRSFAEYREPDPVVVGDEHSEPDVTNNPTLAVHAEALKFGVTLTSTSAAYIAEAAIVASGLRVGDEHEEALEAEEMQAKLSASWNDGYNTAKHIYAQAKAETAADIVAKIRAHCTPSAEAYRLGGDRLIAAVADWIERPPEWVDASWFRRPLPIQGDEQ